MLLPSSLPSYVCILNTLVIMAAQLCYLLLPALPFTASHSRFSCPEPRSESTGIKQGPCGRDTNDFGTAQQLLRQTTGGDAIATAVEIKPGPLRVTFEESVHHTGAPFRISLSGDGTDDGPCVLLDHIPHNDCCRPSIGDPATYTPYAITINIPNVACERCSLHLSNPMTDKIGPSGSPSGAGCTDPGTCFSVYHSCTKHFRIVGDADAVPRSEYQCPNYQSINQDWPTVWLGDEGDVVDASVPGVYRRESSVWSTEDSATLTTAPVQYQEDEGRFLMHVGFHVVEVFIFNSCPNSGCTFFILYVQVVYVVRIQIIYHPL